MKENSIEKLQERLETLHVIQDARLACNADDLDIREEIAEVEEEIKELQDDTNVDRENSIKNERSSVEEDIEILEKNIKSVKENADMAFFESNEDYYFFKAVEHILSDYKRVLKENEELKSENSRLKVIRYSTEYGTENIHLITKSDLVQIDINKYMIEIEDGKFVDLKQVYQENKELHKETERMKSLDIYKLVENWETGQLISKQTIKDNIKEYTNMLKDCNKAKDIDRIKVINERILMLEELI